MRKSPPKPMKSKSERRPSQKAMSLQKSINSSNAISHNAPHIQINVSPGSISSPPLSAYKSKYSKSKRLYNEPHEILPLTCKDYCWIVVGYLILWSFYAAVWYAAWAIYLSTTPATKPRYPHNQTQITAGSSRSSNLLLCDE